MYMYTQGHSRLVSTGAYIPEERITSREVMEQCNLESQLGIPPDWLERTTGIRERRVAPTHMAPSDMASAAAKEALEQGGLFAQQINAIIYAGVIRDNIEPATAHIVQDKIGARSAVALDVSNACLGFMSAIHLMDALIATGQVRYGLVVTGERGYDFARLAIEALKHNVDRHIANDLFAGLTLGDAGAAAIMGSKVRPDAGFMGFIAQSDSRFHDLCVCGDSTTDYLLVTKVTAIVAETAKLVRPMCQELMGKILKWQPQQLGKYVPHQVGMRSVKLHAELADVSLDIIPVSVDFLGNVISATIPLNLQLLARENKLQSGEKVYLSGTGSGICLNQAGLIWDAA